MFNYGFYHPMRNSRRLSLVLYRHLTFPPHHLLFVDVVFVILHRPPLPRLGDLPFHMGFSAQKKSYPLKRENRRRELYKTDDQFKCSQRYGITMYLFRLWHLWTDSYVLFDGLLGKLFRSFWGGIFTGLIKVLLVLMSHCCIWDMIFMESPNWLM